MRAWLGLVLVLGCGGSEPVLTDEARSGTRLKLGWLDFAGGLRTWAQGPVGGPDLLDATLQLPCALRAWDDGVARCTPSLGPVHYEDAACTQPVLPEHTTPFHAEGDAVHPRGKLYVRSTRSKILETVYELREGRCEGASSTGFVVFEVERIGPPSQLASVERAYSDDEPIAVEVARSDDGLTVPLGLYDRSLESECDFDAGSAPNGRCAPTDWRFFEHFADAACREPVVVGAPRPRFAATGSYACLRYFEVGEALPEQPLFQQLAQCQASNGLPEQSAYRVGREIELQTLEQSAEPGTGRAGLVYLAHGNTRYRRPDRFFDGALQTECTMDGGTCDVPLANYRGALFSDDACTMAISPLAGVPLGGGSCDIPRVPAVVLTPQGRRVVGAKHAGDVYQQIEIGCVFLPETLHEIGGPAPGVITAELVRDP